MSPFIYTHFCLFFRLKIVIYNKLTPIFQTQISYADAQLTVKWIQLFILNYFV